MSRRSHWSLSLSLSLSVCLSLLRPRNQPLFSSPSERSSHPPHGHRTTSLLPSGCPAGGHLIGEPPIDSTFHPGFDCPRRPGSSLANRSFSAAAICRHAENHRARGLPPPRVGGGIRRPSSRKGRALQHSRSRPAIAASVECGGGPTPNNLLANASDAVAGPLNGFALHRGGKDWKSFPTWIW